MASHIKVEEQNIRYIEHEAELLLGHEVLPDRRIRPRSTIQLPGCRYRLWEDEARELYREARPYTQR